MTIAVAPPQSLAAIQAEADEVVCLYSPEEFYAGGQFFEDFSEVTGEMVVKALSGVSRVARRDRRERSHVQHGHWGAIRLRNRHGMIERASRMIGEIDRTKNTLDRDHRSDARTASRIPDPRPALRSRHRGPIPEVMSMLVMRRIKSTNNGVTSYDWHEIAQAALGNTEMYVFSSNLPAAYKARVEPADDEAVVEHFTAAVAYEKSPFVTSGF